jgi:xanthine dehydrogenase YagR molybdenum-binding subunit
MARARKRVAKRSTSRSSAAASLHRAERAASAPPLAQPGAQPAAQADSPSWPARATLREINHEHPRLDGPEKISGRARYTHDMRLPGMVFARVLCCPYPTAEVKIDVAPARAISGVDTAIVLVKEKTSYLGQPVAAVAARTPEIAEDGLRALKVEYKQLPWCVDHAQAMAENAPKVRKAGNRDVSESSDDLDAAKAELAKSAAVVEATYTVPVQHHAALETHGVVVDYRGGDEATIYASTQETFSIAGDAASELGLKANQVTAIVQYMGGGFGAKFGLGQEGQIACRLAKELKKPVHLMLARGDEFVTAGNRSGNRATLAGGISAEGDLTALVAHVDKLGGLGQGAYARQPYIYKPKVHFTEIASVFTNTDQSRAMRAPGHPQASFGIESLIDELAYKLGLDPLEVRKRNLKSPVYERQLDAVAEAIGWRDHPNRTAPGKSDGGLNVGIGFAVSTWGGGGHAGCQVDVRVERDGSVSASVGTQDLGTGTRTYIASITAEELGLATTDVHVEIGSTKLGRSVGSGGSTTTASLAPAVEHAAWQVKRILAEKVADTLRTKPDAVRFANGRVFDAADSTRALDWKQACALLGTEGVAARGVWQKELAANGVHGAQAAKVRVDTLTGRVEVLAMVGMQDCGLPLNRMAIRSQLNGGMVQSLSYALFEQRVIDRDLGLMLNANFEDYKLAASLEMPEMQSLIDDADERQAPIGMAEPAIIAGHGAIANAVFNACGARIRDLPLTPDKVLTALGKT